ncbi:MAG: hypothetical protein SGARI_005444, partial [Bacillariaceae sp.]
MSASPGAEDSFEWMGGNADAHHDDDERAKNKQTDFNFSSLWRKPRLSRRLLRPSIDKANHHVMLDSPHSQEDISINYNTPGKKQNSATKQPQRNVKDRESFETMGSPHLSELDETRDVVPAIMKREGWDFGREVPEGCDKSVETSSTKRREMNPRMFLTPTPTKTKPLRHSQKDTPSDLAKLTPVRSEEYYTRKKNRSHPWEQHIESKKQQAIESKKQQDIGHTPQSPSSRVDKPNVASPKSESFMEDVEIYRGEYLTSDAYLSSISEDSGDSYPKQQQQQSIPKRESNVMETHNRMAEKVTAPIAPCGKSFSDRLKMFQSKERSQVQAAPFRRNKAVTEGAFEASPIPTTESVSKNEVETLVKQPTDEIQKEVSEKAPELMDNTAADGHEIN